MVLCRPEQSPMVRGHIRRKQSGHFDVPEDLPEKWSMVVACLNLGTVSILGIKNLELGLMFKMFWMYSFPVNQHQSLRRRISGVGLICTVQWKADSRGTCRLCWRLILGRMIARSDLGEMKTDACQVI